MKEVQLKVAKAYPNDSGRGIARLDPQTMLALQLSPGDIVEVEGKKVTAAKVWRADRIDWDQGALRVDGFIRQNAGVGMGDVVRVRKAEVHGAVKILLAPTEGPGLKFGGDAGEMVKRQILKRPVVKGDVIPVMSTMAHPFLGRVVTGQSIPLVAVETEPAGVVLITEKTEVILHDKPLDGFEATAAGVTYEDIGGLGGEIQRVREMIELPMKHPELFQQLGIQPPNGILMYGPPGTGKTLIARAVANESGAHFIAIAGPEIMSKYYGESEQRLREIFEEAGQNTPAIVFIDELDSIAPRREEVTGEVERRVVAQLLTMMDGLEERGQVVVIGATNRIDAVDPALRRPGRFDREVEIGVPDRQGRKEILQIHSRGMPIYAWDSEVVAEILLEELESFEERAVVRISENVSKIESLELEESSIENELQRGKNELKKLEGELKRTKGELERLEIEKQQAKGSLIQRILDTITDKQSQVNELLSEMEEVRMGIESGKNDIKKLKERRENNKNTIKKLKNDIHSINKINETMRKEKGILESIAADLESIAAKISDIKRTESSRGAEDIRNIFSEKELQQKGTEVRNIEKIILDLGIISPEYIKKVIEGSTSHMLNHLASATHGFVGADISALTKEAAMKTLRRYLPQINLEEEIPKELLDSMRVTQKDFDEALREVEPSAMREVLIEVPMTTWDDVGGLEDVRQEIREAVEWPLTHPDKFRKMGIHPPKGILLYGPPGTGKTLVAKAVARETAANFISIRGPQLLSKWVGESERAMREVFKKARQVAPCIIFFDEIDAIAPVRGGDTNRAVERMVNQLLTELDGLETLEDVMIIGATNRPDIIDPALLRTGRFDRMVLLEAPAKKGRMEIFRIHTKEMPLSEDVDFEELTEVTDGYTGADIESVCRETVMLALREDINAKGVEMRHFRDALKKVHPSLAENIMDYYERIKDQFKGGKPKEEKSYIGYR
ncbi:AAA family ATPase [Methanosarcinales archaeon ex4484_138]|nr:MAG: AAA family ATPase [Methanosarcinales archaeon ex4484_138]